VIFYILKTRIGRGDATNQQRCHKSFTHTHKTLKLERILLLFSPLADFCSHYHYIYYYFLSFTGIFVLGEKLGMDATEDIRILVLLWKMGCGSEKPAQISKQEWMQGCAKLEVDSWEKLQKLVPSLDTGFLEQTPFKDFYKFCFQFNRQGTHKTLDKELAIALMKLVLKDSNRIPAHRLDTFCSFLQASAHSHITLDEWTLFLDFCFEYTSDDLSSYDESTSAWPVLFDEYVEYIEKNHGNGKSGK
jgi:Cullin binding